MIKLFKLDSIKKLIQTLGYYLTDEELEEINSVLDKAIDRMAWEIQRNTYKN